MRIALSNGSFKWGGVHVVTDALVEGLQRRGHEVLLLCRAGSELEARMNGRVATAPVIRGMDLSPLAILRIARTLTRFRPEVVLTLMDKDVRLTGPAAHILGIPFVARRANDRPLPAHPLARMLYGSYPALHVANSEATRKTMLASAPYLDPARVEVIHNGIDAAAVAETRPAPLPVPTGAFTVAFAGRLEERKGIIDLIAAWPDVLENIPDAHLVLAGRGPLEAYVTDRAAQLDNVHFLGYRTDIAAVFRASDTVVVPSHWEGFGLVALEALAAGTPVVATSASSLPEIVRDGVDGLLVPPRTPQALAAAIVALARNPDARSRMGAAGAAHARDDFSLERMIDRYEEVLRKAAATS